jgi:DNA-3-methyladenine glycosylase
MHAVRPRVTRDRDLCRGPARLTQAMGINGSHDGMDLVGASENFTIVDDGVTPPENITGSLRIGISQGKDFPWRWSVPGNRYVSGTASQRG